MAKDTSHIYRIQQGGVVAMYPHLLKPRKDNFDEGKLSYEVTLVIPPTHLDCPPLFATALAVLKKSFPKVKELTEKQSPFADGDEWAEKYPKTAEWAPGNVLLKAHASVEFPPTLFVLRDGKAVELTGELERAMAQNEYFYSGVRVGATVAFRAFTGFGGGLTCYINSVLSTGKGERIGGADANEMYADLIAAA